jgi:hypothetical protein
MTTGGSHRYAVTEPDPELAPGRRVGVTIAQQSGNGGQFPDVAQHRVAVPGPNVLPIGSNEAIALVVREPEP